MTKGEERWMTRCPGCDAELPDIDSLRSRVAKLEGTVQAMTETAAEQSRVHAEMHGDLVVQDELILKLGSEAERYRAALELIASTCQDLAAQTTACMALGANNPD